jgi:hypothetical protein
MVKTQIKLVSSTVRPTRSRPRDLEVYSRAVWPLQAAHFREKWIEAVIYLRTTKKGWINDNPIELQKLTQKTLF